MPKIDLQANLGVPAVPARAAISEIMQDIQAHRGDWRDFALHLDLGAMGLPDVGYVAIPVTISQVSEQLEPRHEIRFQLQAARGAQSFPTFTGALGVDSTGPSSAHIWLAGEYTVPLHGLGALLDQTLAHGSAETTLKNMLADLCEAVDARVQNRERAAARYRLAFRAD